MWPSLGANPHRATLGSGFFHVAVVQIEPDVTDRSRSLGFDAADRTVLVVFARRAEHMRALAPARQRPIISELGHLDVFVDATLHAAGFVLLQARCFAAPGHRGRVGKARLADLGAALLRRDLVDRWRVAALRLIGLPPDLLRCDMKVEVSYQSITGEITLPKFKPVAG